MRSGRNHIWRREVERLTLSLPVSWGADDACVHKGLLTSLSTKGALIEGPVAFLPHEVIYLRLPDGAGGHLQLIGEVVYYVSGAGVAIQFIDLTAEQRAALDALVEHYRAAGDRTMTPQADAP